MYGSRKSTIGAVAVFGAVLGGVHGCATSVSPGFGDDGGSGSNGTGGASGAVDGAAMASSGSAGSSGGSSGGGSFAASGTSFTGGGSGGSSGNVAGSSGNGSGGSSGGGSSGGVVVTDSGPCTSLLIDNMENGMGAIFSACGRIGFWYTYNDKTPGGTQTPAAGAMFTDSAIMPPRGSSMMAARTTGSGFTVYGAGMGVDLNNPGGTAPKSTYNASMYSGVTFWVMGSAGGTVRFNVSDKATDPSGGICMGTSGATQCNDHHGHTLMLGMTWQEVTFSWSQLTQQGFGYTEASLDVAHLVGMQFQISSPTGSFDLWVDDIAFTP